MSRCDQQVAEKETKTKRKHKYKWKQKLRSSDFILLGCFSGYIRKWAKIKPTVMWEIFHVQVLVPHFLKLLSAHLGNMWPVSFTSLQGMWCFTSGLLIHVWMLTISFLSSSDMDELSISSGGTSGWYNSATCYNYLLWCVIRWCWAVAGFTCVILFFITNAEYRLYSSVRFTYAVTAAHMPRHKNQQYICDNYSSTWWKAWCYKKSCDGKSLNTEKLHTNSNDMKASRLQWKS